MALASVILLIAFLFTAMGCAFLWSEVGRHRAENAAKTWYDLGVALAEQKDLSSAISAYHKALAIDPKDPRTWNNFGLALLYQGDFPAAIQALDQALAIYPNYARARNNHTVALKLLALEKRLPGVLHGDAASVEDLLTLADLCWRFKRRYRDATQLYTRAFAAEPKSAEDLGKGIRYEAARAAALAAAGKGDDSDKLNAEDQIRLRKQAFDWLQADLTASAKLLEKNPVAAIKFIDDMQQWQRDADLASLRDEDELAKLPPDERAALTKLWGEVDRLVKEARSR